MAARVEFLGRCEPCKHAVDLFPRGGVLHRACDGARAQLVAVGNRRCGDCAVRHGGDLVHRADLDSQSDVLIVYALDYHGHCTHRTSGFHVIFLNGQGQLAVFHLRTIGVIAVGQVDSWCAVGHRAVLPGSLQRRQQRGQINRIRRRVVVRDLQRLGRGGNDDRPVDKNKLTAAAAAVFDLHLPAAIGKDKVAAGCQRHCAGECSVSGFRGVEFHIAQLVVALVQIKIIHS